MKRFLSLILSLALICSISVFPANSAEEPTYKSGKYTYTINNNEITIVSYSTYPFGSLEVTSEIDGLPVTAIGPNAFLNTRVTEITLPDSIKRIENKGFNSSRIEKITLGNGIEYIGEEAFSFCTSLTEITIPDSVTEIGQYAFNRCSKLVTVNLGKGITEIPDACFGECTALKTINKKSIVTKIGSSAFYQCQKLTSFTLDDGLETINNSVFYGCSSLPGIKIPQSVTAIGSFAFNSCTSLKEITLPNNLKTIGAHAFSGCRFSEIYVPESVTSIEDWAFANCISLEKAIFDCTLNGNLDVFADCYSLKNFSVPEGVTNLTACFLNCRQLRTVYIPLSIEYITTATFNGCDSLTDIYFAGSEEDWNARLTTDKYYSKFPDTVTIHFNSTQNDAFPREYQLTLNENKYMIKVGETVEISAPFAIPYGLTCFAFDKWVILHGNVTLEDYESNVQYITMPDHDVRISTEYYLVGDVAQSEAINSMDILTLQVSVKNGGTYAKHRDINLDGTVDAFDLIALMSIIKGDYDYAPYFAE